MTERILVVDDIAENRYLLVALLSGHGYEVETAADGAEALAVARARPPALVVTDVLMPVMDGFELCRRWKGDPELARIPFLVYTATYTDPRDEELALQLGADRFLLKPQKVEVLLSVVRELLAPPGGGRPEPGSGPCRESLELALRHNEVLLRKLEKKVTQLEREIVLRDEVERELKASSARWQGTFDAMLDPVALITPEGTITRANRAMCEYLGLPASAVEGSQCFRLFHSLNEHIEGCPLVVSRKSGGRETMEMVVGDRTFYVVTDPMPDADGHVSGYIHILRDITSHKRTEAEIGRASCRERV